MAGANLILDDSEVRTALGKMQQAGSDLRPALREIGEYLDLSTRQRFDNERDPDGNRWEPLSDTTLRNAMLRGVSRSKSSKRRSLRARGGGTKRGAVGALANKRILVVSGMLRDTLRYQLDSHGLRFGTDLIYGAPHQFGYPKKGIPARPFLGFSAEDKIEIIAILRGHLKAAIGR